MTNAWFPIIEQNQGVLTLLGLALAVWVARREIRRAEADARSRIVEPTAQALGLVVLLHKASVDAVKPGADVAKYIRTATMITAMLENVSTQPIPDMHALHGVMDALVTVRRLAALQAGGGEETRRGIRAELGRLEAIQETLEHVLRSRPDTR